MEIAGLKFGYQQGLQDSQHDFQSTQNNLNRELEEKLAGQKTTAGKEQVFWNNLRDSQRTLAAVYQKDLDKADELFMGAKYPAEGDRYKERLAENYQRAKAASEQTFSDRARELGIKGFVPSTPTAVKPTISYDDAVAEARRRGLIK